MRQKILIYEKNSLLASGLYQTLSHSYDVELNDGIKEVPNFERGDNLSAVIIGLKEIEIGLLVEFKKTYPTLNTVIMCEAYNNASIMELLSAGVQAILLNDTNTDQMLEVLGKLSIDKTYVDTLLTPLLVRIIAKIMDTGIFHDNNKMTSRELQVLSYILQGLSNKEISSRLHITLSTVKYHTTNIYKKYCVNSRRELLNKASKNDHFELKI